MALNLGSAAKTPGPQHRRYLHDLANESHPFRRSTWRDVARDGTGFFSTHCHVLHFVLMYMHSRVSRSQHGRHVMNRKKRERERERGSLGFNPEMPMPVTSLSRSIHCSFTLWALAYSPKEHGSMTERVSTHLSKD